MKPTFLLIGAGKCGTTSLCHYLSQHPDIFISDPKEPGYFTLNQHKGWNWYCSLFAHGEHYKAIGEGTVNYSKSHLYPLAAEQIARALPDAKIIYLTRHPLKRIVSEWKYKTLKGDEKRPFNEALLAESDYIDTSNYKKQLGIFQQHYTDKQIKVLFLEDLQDNTESTLQECFNFLGVLQNNNIADLKPKNTGTATISVSPLVRLARTLPGFDVIRQYFPAGWRYYARKALGRKMSEIDQLKAPVIWNQDVLTTAVKALKFDTEAFLTHHGKSKDFWNLDKFYEEQLNQAKLDPIQTND